MTAPAKLTEPEIQEAVKSIPGWERNTDSIVRLYKFNDFNEAMVFVNRTAGLAERADHHPDILIRYNKVTLTLSTHSAGGLTKKDFQLAREIDRS